MMFLIPVMSLVPVLVSHDANSIINSLISFLNTGQLKRGTTVLVM